MRVGTVVTEVQRASARRDSEKTIKKERLPKILINNKTIYTYEKDFFVDI